MKSFLKTLLINIGKAAIAVFMELLFIFSGALIFYGIDHSLWLFLIGSIGMSIWGGIVKTFIDSSSGY